MTDGRQTDRHPRAVQFPAAVYRGWTRKHRYIVSTWLYDHPSARWFHETGQAIISEDSDDSLAFRVWIGGDPFGLARKFGPQVEGVRAMFEAD